MRQFTVDPEFRDKIPPLSADEFAKLEENIISDGEIREPLVVWHNTIIDGHHRWAIIQKHPEIPYKVKQMDFPDKWAAIVWMCRNQLGRRNLTDEQRTYTIGKMYEAQKMAQGAQRGNINAKKQSAQNEHFVSKKSAERIADELKIGKETVKRAEHFSKSLDEAETISPGIREAVLTGEVSVPKRVISEIRKAPSERKPEVVAAIRRGDVSEAKRIITEMNPPREDLQEDKPCVFTTEMLCEQLKAAMDNLDAILKQDLVMVHRDMLDKPDCRNAVTDVLRYGRTVIQKYENMIRRIGEDG